MTELTGKTVPLIAALGTRGRAQAGRLAPGRAGLPLPGRLDAGDGEEFAAETARPCVGQNIAINGGC